jgi:serine/threonine-protein kinase HipA
MKMSELTVELYGVHIGSLVGSSRTFDLIMSDEGIRAFGIDSTVLSLAVPMAVTPVRSHKARRQNFFHELLPEGPMLRALAQRSGLDESDTIGLLANFGRDVAGALQIWDPQRPGEPKNPGLEPLSIAGVADMLRNVRRDPLGNTTTSGKTSLAGVQDKIVLARSTQGWSRVIDGWPSSHILKPVSSEYPTMIFDEEYGARFARALGLTTYETWLDRFDDVDALVIERYDRSPSAPGGRIHQEDCNQILGASGMQKYQRFGGRVSLQRIAALFSSQGDADSLARLVTLLVLAVAVGNLDLHAKNISVLHPMNGPWTLAPAYDVVPQTHLDNDGEMALAISGEYRHAYVTKQHLVDEVASWGVRDAERQITETLEQVLAIARVEEPHELAAGRMQSDIIGFTSNVLEGRSAGGN